MKKLKFYVILLCATFLVACDLNIQTHNYADAVDTSREFIKTLYIQEDLDGAFSSVHPYLSSQVTKRQLADLLGQAHQSGYPNTFYILGYGPDVETNGVVIHMRTGNTNPVLYYEIIALEAEEGGYQVGGFWIGDERFDTSGSFEEFTPPSRFN